MTPVECSVAINKDISAGLAQFTCRSKLEVMMTTKEDVFGNFNSGSGVVCGCESTAVGRLCNMLPLIMVTRIDGDQQRVCFNGRKSLVLGQPIRVVPGE